MWMILLWYRIGGGETYTSDEERPDNSENHLLEAVQHYNDTCEKRRLACGRIVVPLRAGRSVLVH